MIKIDKHFSLLTTFAVFAIFLIFSSCNSGIEIQNPYKKVNWEKHQQFTANLHTHTTHSDGRMSPNTVVDKYHKLSYDILALTDHNEVTYPWTEFEKMEPSQLSVNRSKNGQCDPEELIYKNRYPEKLGMLAVQGNELSSHHHMGSYFSDHNGTKTIEESLKATAEKNGLIIFNHPGRYKQSIDWYVDFYNRYDHLIGIEVYNAIDRYPHDREKWDSILVRIMPQKPVWGFANDDMHGESILGYNWNLFILPELSINSFRSGMEDGSFFYVHSPKKYDSAQPPYINAINCTKTTIKIDALGKDSIRWISGGKVIHKGETIDLKNFPELSGYVRAELFGPDLTVLGTQPFGIISQ